VKCSKITSGQLQKTKNANSIKDVFAEFLTEPAKRALRSKRVIIDNRSGPEQQRKAST
jgi:hypothetical protein